MNGAMRRSWVLIAFLAAACGSSSPPHPPASGGDGTSPASETITGRERLGWNQLANTQAELASFRYAIYVDGARSEVADVSCSATSEAAGFPCSGKLPPMTNGAHTLALATFVVKNGATFESARSFPLRVSMAASTAPIADWSGGQVAATPDGVGLQAEKLVDGLESPIDAAFDPDGRLFIAERAGAVRIFDGARLSANAVRWRLAPDEDPPEILSIVVDPDFTRTHFVFVVQAAITASGRVVRLTRYREVRGTLGERATLFETASASGDKPDSAAARFGSDGKLYLALGGDAVSGRLLRLNGDGTLPRDQSGTTPAIATGIAAARGLGWQDQSGMLWIADVADDGAHLTGLSMSAPPVRAIVRGRRDVAGGVASMAFYHGNTLPAMRGDALIASPAGSIVRLRFAVDDPTRIESTEPLFEQNAGAVRVVAVSPAGVIYFCTPTALARLAAR